MPGEGVPVVAFIPAMQGGSISAYEPARQGLCTDPHAV